MYVVVLVLGVIALIVGGSATAFGLTIKEFSLGGTLMITGTTMMVGGLVMIAVAGAIRELRRIAVALNSGRQQPRYPRPGEPHEPVAPSSMRPPMPMPMPIPRAPSPPSPLGPRGGRDLPPDRDMRPGERRLFGGTEPAVAVVEPQPEPSAPAQQPVTAAQPADEPEQLTLLPTEPPPLAPSVAVEPPPVVDETDTIPLSPEDSREPPMGDQTPPSERVDEPTAETKAEDEPANDIEEHVEKDIEKAEEAPTPSVEPPAPTAAERHSLFDSIWPKRQRAAAARPAEEVTDRTESSGAPPFEDSAPPVQDVVQDTAPISPEAETSPATSPAAEPRPETADHRPPAYPVSILKSGVVDGMAYTLYSDGSIEAELPTGTIRFESINELRAHLERTN
jgi:hypothetical protein